MGTPQVPWGAHHMRKMYTVPEYYISGQSLAPLPISEKLRQANNQLLHGADACACEKINCFRKKKNFVLHSLFRQLLPQLYVELFLPLTPPPPPPARLICSLCLRAFSVCPLASFAARLLALLSEPKQWSAHSPSAGRSTTTSCSGAGSLLRQCIGRHVLSLPRGEVDLNLPTVGGLLPKPRPFIPVLVCSRAAATPPNTRRLASTSRSEAGRLPHRFSPPAYLVCRPDLKKPVSTQFWSPRRAPDKLAASRSAFVRHDLVHHGPGLDMALSMIPDRS